MPVVAVPAGPTGMRTQRCRGGELRVRGFMQSVSNAAKHLVVCCRKFCPCLAVTRCTIECDGPEERDGVLKIQRVFTWIPDNSLQCGQQIDAHDRSRQVRERAYRLKEASPSIDQAFKHSCGLGTVTEACVTPAKSDGRRSTV